ncbi:phosphoribosyl transferase [Kitasatospora sp. MMS16-BH015]|uniref:phosphoribosyltransferase family protein n=1 Tax=Kitasatospora sp. MMS16-BH015 TaxID=2018025 RepID=UPI000CA11117|nr:phosphoribosyltransferase family protein [Kitasatospora sp. MMS16-BH015]AUG80764.1 phosphoribosyl transferase [Kitasatospora sp. MMS16-BH015]
MASDHPQRYTDRHTDPYADGYADRAEAGLRLAEVLGHLRGADPVVVGLPRGGVPVAARVAAALGAPLDLCVIRKLGCPGQPELAMGAIGEDGARVLNPQVLAVAGVTEAQLAEVERAERAELARRVDRYRRGHPAVPVAGRTVVVVDDGLATGATARAACAILRARGAAHLVLAVPVAPSDWTRTMAGAAEELVCPLTPHGFRAIGQYYARFDQTTDAEVVACLAAAAPRPELTETFAVETATTPLTAELTSPAHPLGVVVFAHGSGSSRLSPRNRSVAAALRRAGLATVLTDLLTPAEAEDRELVFDLSLLAERLIAVTERCCPPGLPLGWFGASTGAAAALRAAAEPTARVAAIVSRGGRPDLAGPWLGRARAPTLLIVGGADHAVLDLNRTAAAALTCEHALAVVPGATHLFAEPGALPAVASLAAEWFGRHFKPGPDSSHTPPGNAGQSDQC